MRILVLADTHIPKRAKDLPARIYDELSKCNGVIHAGDVLSQGVLDKLKSFGPVYAVRGNNDVDLNLPERLELTFEGICVGVIHDSGSATGRAARMRKRFPQARIVVFGHSHIPWNSDDGSLLLFNPGSPTDKRMQPEATFGLLEFGQGGTIRADILPL